MRLIFRAMVNGGSGNGCNSAQLKFIGHIIVVLVATPGSR